MVSYRTADTIEDALKGRYHAPSELRFCDANNEPTIDFLDAEDLRGMAERMIDEYEELNYLRKYELAYLWKRDGGKSGGKNTLGKCTKASGLVKYFSQATWVIWLTAKHVNEMLFTRKQVEASLYHELAHAALEVDEEGNGKPVVIAHDFAGFVAEVKRFGDWMADLKDCKKAWEQWEQMALPVER